MEKSAEVWCGETEQQLSDMSDDRRDTTAANFWNQTF